MSARAKHLLHFAAAAIFLYFLAFVFDREQAPVVFAVFLGAGAIAEIGFWVHLFKRG